MLLGLAKPGRTDVADDEQQHGGGRRIEDPALIARYPEADRLGAADGRFGPRIAGIHVRPFRA